MPLILTLKIDDDSFGFLDELRRRYFPPERNFLDAHVTLFHHLPDKNLEQIKLDIQKLCAETRVFPLEFTHWRFLGKGSAMVIESAALVQLREQLAQVWREDLTPQDEQKFQPHITVQNKVEATEARKLFEKLSADWHGKNGEAQGLTLWHYLGGAWKSEEEFLFMP